MFGPRCGQQFYLINRIFKTREFQKAKFEDAEMFGTESKSIFKIHVDLEHFSPRNHLFSAKPQNESFGENICMKITSLLFTHYSKPNMLNSNMSMTHEFDVLETTAQGITEPGLPNRDHILAQPFAGKI